MSYAAEKWARSQCVGNARAKQVLIELANCLNDETGLCCPGREYLHRVTELKKETISNATAYLEGRGLIRKTRFSTQNSHGICYELIGYKKPENGLQDRPENGSEDRPENGSQGVMQKPENGSEGRPENGSQDRPENGSLTDKDNREKEPSPAPAREAVVPSRPIRPAYRAWSVADALLSTGDSAVLTVAGGDRESAKGRLYALLTGTLADFQKVHPLLVKHQIGV